MLDTSLADFAVEKFLLGAGGEGFEGAGRGGGHFGCMEGVDAVEDRFWSWRC